MEQKLLSIIFSFRNEAANLRELVSRVDKSISEIKDYNYELIFINDDSTDESLDILLDLKNDYPIKIINMSRVFGGPPCIIAGFTHSRGDAIINMDSDLQDPPEFIPEMVKRYDEGFDVVHTYRTARLGEPRVKMFITKIAYKFIRVTSDLDIKENSGDFRLWSRRAINEILKIKEIDPSFPGLSIWIGFKQCYLPYVRRERFAGIPQFGLFSKGPINHFSRAILSNSKLPLQILFLLGVIVLTCALGLATYAIIGKLSGKIEGGVPSILIAISFFSGLIILSIGVVGLYISRIYDQVKGRPRYIISEIID